jgi:hypothetical protein
VERLGKLTVLMTLIFGWNLGHILNVLVVLGFQFFKGESIMVTLTFAQTPDDSSCEENVTLRFIVDNDIHIRDFHRLCKRFALAVGYSEGLVDNYFGETVWE